MSDGRRRAPSFDVLITGTFALGGWIVGLQPIYDNSYLWHLRTGHLILDQGLPRTDPYSFTAVGADWVVQSWLAEVLYAGVDSLVGAFGLRLLSAVTGALLLAGLSTLSRRICGDPWRAAGVTLVAAATVGTMWTDRPLALGLLGLLALVAIVELAPPRLVSGRRLLVVLPVLFWLWGNVHGSFALGFAYVALHLLGRWLEGRRPWVGPERMLLGGSLLAAVLLLANPYGLGLVLFPLRAFERNEIFRQVVEWQSPDFRTLNGIAYAAWLAVTVVSLTRGRRPGRRDVLVAVPFLLSALVAQRNVAVAPIVTVPIVSRALAVREPRTRVRPSANVGLVFASVLVVVAVALTADASREPDLDLDRYPTQAMDDLADRDLLGGRLLTTVPWGGYVISEWWPEQEVFVDDRFDMYPTEVFDDYLEVDRIRADWAGVLDRRGVEFVVWESDAPLTQVLDESDAWTRLHTDDTAVVFERADAAAGAP